MKRDKSWWIRNILHIETLFVACSIAIICYLVWKGKHKLKLNLKLPHPETKPSIKKPEKRINKTEEKCRTIFENIFKVEFKTIRPDWLKNPVPNGKNLELDGFNPTIKTPIGQGLAFEYDGEQHSKYNKHFHRSGPMEFVYQTKKDTWKDMKCKEKKIILIRIPHFILSHDLERYIKEKINRLGIETPHDYAKHSHPKPPIGMDRVKNNR